ncbi:MAG TPA: response regulator [Bdellovibrionales bacterium]|nr:response regulator [Bdellovibrionales bacterium]
MSEAGGIFEKIEDVTVLVVDDDAMVMSIVVEYLKSFGFKHILEAKDGKAAIKILQDPHQRVDMILSDWEMPNVDGHTLLKAVRNHPTRSSVKFLMVTSQNSRERTKIAQARQLNVDAYIVKPFRGEILREKIFKVLGLDKDAPKQAG